MGRPKNVVEDLKWEETGSVRLMERPSSRLVCTEPGRSIKYIRTPGVGGSAMLVRGTSRRHEAKAFELRHDVRWSDAPRLRGSRCSVCSRSRELAALPVTDDPDRRA